MRILPVLLGAVLVASPVFASDEDTQIWNAFAASKNLNDRYVLNLDVQLRWTDEARRLGQYVVRPSVGLKLNKKATVSAGYAYVHTDPVGPAESDEQRLWQQLSYNLLGSSKDVMISSRTRFEQRWIEGSDDLGLRFRQQLRASVPVHDKILAVAWSEVFLNLNDTNWGQSAGLDRWRNSVALSVPISDTVTIEPGYLNQWVVRDGDDRFHHIANISVSARF